MKITNDVKYIGVNDHQIDLFEGMYVVPNGMAYNSYAIIDEKIAIMDSVDASFCDEWFENIETALDGRTPDYLVVQHMEPDHSANVLAFANKYPNALIVSSKQAFAMMKNFFGTDFAGRNLVVGEGNTLSLGKHTLNFVTAPMVHWPEVIVTYDSHDKILFSADAFGKFGALDVEEDWACEARRYYFGIVGKFGVQAQALLKKAANLDISIICPLHGPVLSENLDYYLNLYNTWTTYGVEKEGVVICYTSVYGNTKKAALELADMLDKKSVKVSVTDLARDDWAEAVEDAFKYGRIVLATTTYNGDIFPTMKFFVQKLVERNFQNRTVGIIENGTWAPMAAKGITALFANSKNITLCDNTVKIMSALNDTSRAQLQALADELSK